MMLQITTLHATVADKPILKGLNLTLNAGEIHAIMGPNGAGKSTLGYVLSGRPGYEVTEGSVTFNGSSTIAAQATLSSSFGVADFFSDADNSVRLAQAVAVAETAGGHDDVNVVVRMRQVAGADLSLMLYEVDDFDAALAKTRHHCTIAAVTRGAAGSVLLAGDDSLTVRREGIRHGACEFLTKPVAPAVLLTCVRRQLHVVALTRGLERLARRLDASPAH